MMSIQIRAFGLGNDAGALVKSAQYCSVQEFSAPDGQVTLLSSDLVLNQWNYLLTSQFNCIDVFPRRPSCRTG